MSLKTWIKEFYPVRAEKVSKQDALDHSIKKWEGLKKKNLLKHQLSSGPDNHAYITDRAGGSSFIDSDTCALCHHYLGEGYDYPCEKCPIVKVNKRSCNSEYDYFCGTGNPVPMLRLLIQTQKETQK